MSSIFYKKYPCRDTLTAGGLIIMYNIYTDLLAIALTKSIFGVLSDSVILENPR